MNSVWLLINIVISKNEDSHKNTNLLIEHCKECL